VPSLKWWKRLLSLTTISRPVTLAMSLTALWQSPQMRRFFMTRSGVPGGVLTRPNAMARRSLWTVVHERAGLGVLVDVVEHVARVRHVPRRADLRVELPHLRVRLPPLGPDRRVLLPRRRPPPRPLLEGSPRVAAGA